MPNLQKTLNTSCDFVCRGICESAAALWCPESCWESVTTGGQNPSTKLSSAQSRWRVKGAHLSWTLVSFPPLHLTFNPVWSGRKKKTEEGDAEEKEVLYDWNDPERNALFLLNWYWCRSITKAGTSQHTLFISWWKAILKNRNVTLKKSIRAE